MKRAITNEALASIWRKSRADGKKSQQDMADSLMVSKKTVQHWEEGYTSPPISTAFEWFEACGVKPLPYFLEVIYPKEFSQDAPDEALIACVKALPPETKKKLLYILKGNHGSEPAGVIDMVTAHLHVPLRDRLNVCQLIIMNFELAKVKGHLISTEAMPNMDILKKSFERAVEAVINNKSNYTNL